MHGKKAKDIYDKVFTLLSDFYDTDLYEFEWRKLKRSVNQVIKLDIPSFLSSL